MGCWHVCPVQTLLVLSTSLLSAQCDSESHLRHRQHSGSHDGSPATKISNHPNTTDIFVNPREEVYLSCYIPQNNVDQVRFGVTWLHDGLIVDTSGRAGHRHRSNPETGQLHISGIRLEDNGLWQCQLQDDSLSHQPSKPLKLVVLDKPKPPYLLVDGRRLDPGNLFIPVKEGLELKLSCIVEGGNPSASLKWALVLSEALDPAILADERGSLGLSVTEPSGSENTSENRVPTQALVLSEAGLLNIQRAHHNATVVCIAQHPALRTPVNASILLDVQYSPSFAISREPGFGFPLREGIPVSLKCDVDSNPPSGPLWQKDDKLPPIPQTSDGFLNFTAIRREHSGWYKCTTTHLGVDYSSIGYFLNVRSELAVNLSQEVPASYPSGRQVAVPLGGAVQLKCPDEGAGCWSRVGSAGRLVPVGTGPGLLLNNVIYQDAGEYRCASPRRPDLERWRSEVNVDVTVIGRPLVYPLDKQLTARLGQRFDMSVEFCANPPVEKAFWVSETRRIAPGQIVDDYIANNLTTGASIHCQQAVLTISRVSMSHAGEYMFLVRSPNGLAEGTLKLNVTRASAYSNAKTIHLNNFLGKLLITAAFVCAVANY